MNQNFLKIQEIIHNRRSIYPGEFKHGLIHKDLLHALIDLARWAPNHRKTEPWRFTILEDEALIRLSQFVGDYYKMHTPIDSFSEHKMIKSQQKALQSSAVIAINIERSPAEIIPAWEETAALACAVQNIWLGATALGLGGYWSSPSARLGFLEVFGIAASECLGFFYLGWPKEGPVSERKRRSVDEYSTWIDK